MIGWLIALSAVCILLTTKVGVHLNWESGTAVMKLRIGAFRFSLSTSKKKKTKVGEKKTQNEPTKRKSKAATKKWIRSLIYHWREVLTLVAQILRTPKLDLLRVQIAVGGADPEDCALNYGRCCALAGTVLPAVQNIIAIKKQDVDVSCHFELTETTILAEIETTVRVFEVIELLFGGFLLLLKLYRYTKNMNEAVQTQ